MPSSVEVVAPSRLHFGLLSFGQPGVRPFGGAGVMIERPGVRLRISPAERFEAAGPLAARVGEVADSYAKFRRLSELPCCRIEVLAAPPQHVGLGTGTQLALSVAAGLSAWRGEPAFDAADLAAVARRAVRSAIGTYGFVLGGLLMEAGRLDDEPLAPLEQRIALNDAWRFVLIVPGTERGLSGEAERRAFESLPPVPRSTTDALLAELANELFPATAGGDFARFSESLFRYGHTAGVCFAARQGGAFASPRIAALVERIRSLGVRGVGQSSWGPTVFAVLETAAAAEDFCRQIRPYTAADDTLITTEPNNTGARITRVG
jgi:beta-RFAP synthase